MSDDYQAGIHAMANRPGHPPCLDSCEDCQGIARLVIDAARPHLVNAARRELVAELRNWVDDHATPIYKPVSSTAYHVVHVADLLAWIDAHRRET